MHTYIRYLTYPRKSDEATNSKPPPPQKSLLPRLQVYLAESFVSSKKDPGGEFRRVLSESTCLMYMYLDPLVSVVRMYRYTPRNKDQANLWGVARYSIGIGMHSGTDWKWSEK